MPTEQRNSYANLILLCRNHHKIIDAQIGEYTVERLHQLKREHESWVKAQLGLDESKQFDDEQYAGMVDTWELLAHVDKWQAWSSHVLSHGQPRMHWSVDRDLQKLRSWLLNRIWPGRYTDLDNAFQNFRWVLQDFHETIREHVEKRDGTDELVTRRFYKISEWDEERYHGLLDRFNFHVDVVGDLMLELTRAANLVCDRVRQNLMRGYRLSEGHLVAQYGPTLEHLAFHDVVVLYKQDELKNEFPYPGFEAFLTERANRDLHFGTGADPSEA